jgi:hypothetical protein
MSLGARQIGNNLVYYRGNRKRLIDAVGPDVVKFIDDFVSPGVASDALDGWVVTLVETGGGGETTVTVPQVSGGALLITTDNADNDGANLQLDGESFELSSDQSAVYFGIRLRMGEATQSDVLVGLCITDTDLLGGMTDGVYFRKVDGATGLAAVTEKDSTETETASVLTVAADTDYLLEFYFDGTSVEFFVDGVSVAKHTANIPDNELLTPSIHFLTGNAAVETCQVDYVRAIQIGR